MGHIAQAEIDAWQVHQRETSHMTYMVSLRLPKFRHVHPKERVIYRRRCMVCFEVVYEGPADADEKEIS